MNWSQFKDPVSNTCLVGAEVASWSVTQEVTGWQVHSIQRKYLGKNSNVLQDVIVSRFLFLIDHLLVRVFVLFANGISIKSW